MAGQQQFPPRSFPPGSAQDSPPPPNTDGHHRSFLLDAHLSPLASPPLLRGDDDLYEGVIVDSSSLPSDVPAFVQSLRASLAHWKSQHKRGVWLKLPIENADLVPAAVKEGFGYHHAEPTYIMMTYWIPESPSTLPMNASHQVGVGAFVINNQREVLVVQEKNGPLKGTGIWKMPTGIVNQGEEIFDGAKREVKEETGVDTEFIEVVGFRHSHGAPFQKSDLFFLCMLRPITSEIITQEAEIEVAKWMPFEEFQAQPFYSNSSLLKTIADIAFSSIEGRYRGFSPTLLHIGTQSHESYLYYMGN